MTAPVQATAASLARHRGLLGASPILAAVSGGRDSTALACILAELRAAGSLPNPVTLAHVDHGAHPASAAAARCVERLGRALGMPVVSTRLTGVPATEAAWRDARYESLGALAGGLDAPVVLTAHHADDEIETVLFRMLRGTGTRGLAGIPELRDLGGGVCVLRPLLRVRAAALHALLGRSGLPWIEDPTNSDPRYARNRLRHERLPALRALHALQAPNGDDFDEQLLGLAAQARRITKIREDRAARLLHDAGRRPAPWRYELDLPDTRQGGGAHRRAPASTVADTTGPAPRYAARAAAHPEFLGEALCRIHAALHPQRRRPPWNWVERVLRLCDMADGRRVHGSGTLLVERTRRGLLFADVAASGAAPDRPVELVDGAPLRFGSTEWRCRLTPHATPPPAPHVAARTAPGAAPAATPGASPGDPSRARVILDPRAAPRPWRLRRRRPADRFQPLGSRRPVDLRRFLQNRHVPRFDRDRLPLLVDARDRVLWVPGCEIAEPARVRRGTGRCFAAELWIVGGELGAESSY